MSDIRDKRWEKVYGKVELVLDNEDEVFRGWLRFYIEVRLGTSRATCQIYVHIEHLQAYPELYKRTLDRMVWNIDKTLAADA